MQQRKRVRPRSTPVPCEGEDGLFTESWFPVCMSSEVVSGQVIGRPFLDGRIVIFRGEDGAANVLSAYCPHLGADLAAGKVVGDRIQCGFHHWEFNTDGWCEKTGLGDPPPKTACVYKFHSMEYDLEARFDHGEGPPLNARVGIYGTSFFRLYGEMMGQWIASMTAFHMVAPGQTQVYYSLGTTKSDGSAEDDARVARTHDLLFRLGKSIIADDRPILHSLKYTPGVMTKSDKALTQYLSMVRNFPRSHESADFIK